MGIEGSEVRGGFSVVVSWRRRGEEGRQGGEEEGSLVAPACGVTSGEIS